MAKERKQGRGRVAVGDEVLEEATGEVEGEGPFASATYGLSRTVNLGEYESVRVVVSATLPCEVGRLSDTFEAATEWVEDRMEERLDALGLLDDE